MPIEIRDLLNENWVRTLIIYRLWGNVSGLYSAFSRAEFRKIIDANHRWDAFKYINTTQAGIAFCKFYNAFDSTSTYELCEALKLCNTCDSYITNTQATFFNMDPKVLQTIFKVVINFHAPASDQEIQEIIFSSLSKYPLLPVWLKNENKALISIF